MLCFKIEIDHLDGTDGVQGNHYGNLDSILNHDPIKMKLYDDDGILYFTVLYWGSQDESLFAPQDWAMNYAGVTTTKIKGEIL